MVDVVLDFNDLVQGTVVNEQYSQYGVTISSSSAANPAMIFNTTNPTGGDADLASDTAGMALIISEDGDSTDPDDNASGGTLTFDFEYSTAVSGLNVLDTEGGGTINCYDAGGNLVKTVEITGTVDGGETWVDVGAEDVRSMDISFNQSGAIDDITLSVETLVAPDDLVSSNLIAKWVFDETSADVAASDDATEFDGVAQDGTFVNGATPVDGGLYLDGVDDYVLVEPDDAFQLGEGSVLLEFTQEASADGALLSRDSANFDDGGHLYLYVTAEGSVEVRHQIAGSDATSDTDGASYYYSTADGFFSAGDDVRVIYSWDEDGVTGNFTVQNRTTGEEYSEDISDCLSLDMGADYNEPITIGASQMYSGDNAASNLSDYFNGTIDTVQIYSAAEETSDGIIEGTSGDDWIDASYTGDPDGDMVDNGDAVLSGTSGDDDTIIAGAGDDTIFGGAGDDTLTGGDGADTFVVLDGDEHATITDFTVTGEEADRLDLSELTNAEGNPVTIDDVTTGTDGDGNAVLSFPNGESLTLEGVPTKSLTTQVLQSMGIPCFTLGTLIATPHGEVPIETLRPGDLVQTLDNGLQPILWIGRRTLGQTELAQWPNLLPIRIRAGALGNRRDMLVSPQHGMITTAETDAPQLARAIHLARNGGRGFRIARGVRSVTYLHLMFERHQILIAEGAATESFYPGPSGLAALGKEHRVEVATLFPDMNGALPLERSYGTTARPFLHRGDISSRTAELFRPARAFG
ncbi:Hint domain-containing protein [Tropicimonas sp. TH_r6]|uniref:Hint domain-containing protein n=1 Tax=Tropicimonas sp. TH_r6 TaxID=3082085 RepID=UPI002955C834|nr:Hint domain-containing protein [Tropicimonas sp. TH_r6]MDV7143743.1 Hint domain-containing protein [Tropicimonas sp. TH_r6]